MENLAKSLTIAQIWAVVASVLVIVMIVSKWSDDVFGMKLGPAVKKLFLYFQTKWFREAAFRQDVMDRLERIQSEVSYNGGKVVLSDAVKLIEKRQGEMYAMMEITTQRMNITELCSERMCFKMNNDGACTFINDAFLKAFGHLESDVLDMAFENIIHPDDVIKMRIKWQRAIDTKSRLTDEQRIKDCNGNYHSCMVKAYPIIINDELKEFSGTIDFITE